MQDSMGAFPVRVHWEDTDAGGIVYHSNYLKYMERARSELIRALGVSQEAERTNPNGLLFVAASVSIRYRRAAKLDDDLVVKTRVKSLGRASIVFEQNVWRGDELITEGEVRVGTISRASMTPVPMPEALYEKISRFARSHGLEEGAK